MGTDLPVARLLVKMPRPPKGATLAVAGAPFAFEPLFSSIPEGKGVGAAAAPRWHVMSGPTRDGVSEWDLCHSMLTDGLGVAGLPAAEFAEPDLEQRWPFGHDAQHALALSRSCDNAAPPDPRLPSGAGTTWFSDPTHSQLQSARAAVGAPPEKDRVRIAHLDTGYDPHHSTLPVGLCAGLQRNFVDSDFPNDATDRSSGLITNLGHGTGTLGILAGNVFQGAPLGGAAFLGVVPVRVADSVVLFRNSAIARALDYVHSLFADGDKRVHVVTMSMGGLASQAWAEAINALYDLGVFVVTAAGNNYGNLPTSHIVFPARFNRVVAACGIMADGKPYADLPITIMAGNYGPERKMATALAAYTPNTPWAKFGCRQIVDGDGAGTSSSTPQIAAAAALWIQKYKAQWEGYAEGWMRVEAVRRALFESAVLPQPELRKWLGHGIVHAADALQKEPAAASALRRQPEDSAKFEFLRVLTGLGATAGDAARLRMFELEALQLSQQSVEVQQALPDPELDAAALSSSAKRRVIEALLAAPSISRALRQHLSGAMQRSVPPPPPTAAEIVASAHALGYAVNPPVPAPAARSLRVFAFDPLTGLTVATMGINEAVLDVRWEADLKPGPVGEYLEVVDVDPSSGCCYAPVDLSHPNVLAQSGLAPSEGTPQFHQQMVYAVAMKTIEYFERALGRVALWAPRPPATRQGRREETYVGRLRIYPHAIREANSYYSPERKALLLGYFPASRRDPGDNLPGGTVFCSLSHDIIAHETAHALLDGLHRRYTEPTNPDALAFHEAFADIVALFQHFTLPAALLNQIHRTRGDLGRQSILGELAQQFGQAIGRYGALRGAIGKKDATTREWKPIDPNTTDYDPTLESHDLGAVLVAAMFDAFLQIYRTRSTDVIRLATNGTGVLPEGDISYDLAARLAEEASKSARHILNLCIRALDYCPAVDITFGDYLRAIITADRDLVPNDALGYRIAVISAFRRRGIYPKGVRNLSVESLLWEHPDVQLKQLPDILQAMSLNWDLHANRRDAYDLSRKNAGLLHNWLTSSSVSDADTLALGFHRGENVHLTIGGQAGQVSRFEVHSVRPTRRIGPDGQHLTNLVVEITQSWTPDGAPPQPKYRGGCTLIVDLERAELRYCIRKSVANADRISAQRAFRLTAAQSSLRGAYFDDRNVAAEPFALRHRGA